MQVPNSSDFAHRKDTALGRSLLKVILASFTLSLFSVAISDTVQADPFRIFKGKKSELPRGFRLEREFDPLSISTSLNEGLPSDDLAAQNAATELRQQAKAWLENRFEELKRGGQLYELEQLEKSAAQGHCVYEDNETHLGTVKVTSVDGNYVFKIKLNVEKFPAAKDVEFLVFDIESLRPDPNRLEIMMKAFQGTSELDQKKVKELAGNPEALDSFIANVAEREGLEEGQIRAYLNAESGHLRKYIARLLLQNDVQALGMQGDNIAMAFFGKKRSMLKFKEWMRTWWEAKKSPITAGRFMVIGIVCGGIQGVATHYMATARIGDIIANGAEHVSLIPLEYVPVAVAAWSLAYGVGMAGINGFYRNVTYSGSTVMRVLKLSFFGAVFAVVYNLIAEPTALVSAGGLLHMALNIGLNQYAKDDAYRISRYRENLQLNTRNWNFKIFPDWLKNQFPKVFGRVPTSIEVKQSDVETQGSYHLLWAFKMLHFTHLASWVILPAAVVIARALAWGYTKSLQSKLKSEFEKSPTPERQRALEATNAQLRDLNKSWWDLYYIPKETGWWIIKSTGKLVKYVSTGIREYLHPELPVTYSGADGNSQVCPRAFSGQSFLPSNPLLAK